MKKVLLACTLFSTTLFAQSPIKPCATDEIYHKEIAEHPEYLEVRKELEEFTKNFKPEDAIRSAPKYVIPIVFHVLHDYGPENISRAQIEDAVRLLNETFNNQNNTSSVVAAFSGIIADAEIEFRLAKKDPNGNCHSGIDRIYTQETYIGDDGSKLNPWPRSRYLNVWTAKELSNGAAAYAKYPGSGSAATDGIMSLSVYIGSIGTGLLSRSSTLSHEVGHWFNLYHTWGNSNDPGEANNCNMDDNVSDTPLTEGNTSCALTGETCGSLDNVQNHMEYSGCRYMFTEGQKTRMHAALNSSAGQRNNLHTSSNLIATGTNDGYVDSPCQPVADFIADVQVVCAGESVTFEDISWRGIPDSWSWTFTGGTPSSSTDSMPTITYNTAGTYAVSLMSGNSGGNSTTKTKTSYITVKPATANMNGVGIIETFDNASTISNNWDVVNTSGVKWDQYSSAGFDDNTSFRLQNSSNTAGSVDEFISAGIDFSSISGNVSVLFDMAYVQKSSESNDQLEVFYSTDCGNTWKIRKKLAGAALATATEQSSSFTPSGSSDWKQQTMIIPGAAVTDNMLIKFTFTAGDSAHKVGNNIYIDYIRTEGVGVKEQHFVSDFSIMPNPSSDEATISFENFQAQNISVKVYNLYGQVMRTLHEGNMGNGTQQFQLRKEDYSTGIYFVELKNDQQVITKRLIFN